MNKKRIVGVALAVGACGVLAAAGMMLSKKSGAVVLDQPEMRLQNLYCRTERSVMSVKTNISLMRISFRRKRSK